MAPLHLAKELLQLVLTGARALGYALIAFLGYGTGLAMLLSGMLKPIFPKQTGLWIGPGIFHFGIHNTDGNVGGVGLLLYTRGPAHELLGWWYIPVTLVISTLLIWGTTLFLRKLINGANGRRQSLSTPPYVSSFV